MVFNIFENQKLLEPPWSSGLPQAAIHLNGTILPWCCTVGNIIPIQLLETCYCLKLTEWIRTTREVCMSVGEGNVEQGICIHQDRNMQYGRKCRNQIDEKQVRRGAPKAGGATTVLQDRAESSETGEENPGMEKVPKQMTEANGKTLMLCSNCWRWYIRELPRASSTAFGSSSSRSAERCLMSLGGMSPQPQGKAEEREMEQLTKDWRQLRRNCRKAAPHDKASLKELWDKLKQNHARLQRVERIGKRRTK